MIISSVQALHHIQYVCTVHMYRLMYLYVQYMGMTDDILFNILKYESSYTTHSAMGITMFMWTYIQTNKKLTQTCWSSLDLLLTLMHVDSHVDTWTSQYKFYCYLAEKLIKNTAFCSNLFIAASPKKKYMTITHSQNPKEYDLSRQTAKVLSFKSFS